MVLKEDCIHFGYSKMNITGNGDRMRRLMDIPNCGVNKMAFGGCSEDCSFYMIDEY